MSVPLSPLRHALTPNTDIGMELWHLARRITVA